MVVPSPLYTRPCDDMFQALVALGHRYEIEVVYGEFGSTDERWRRLTEGLAWGTVGADGSAGFSYEKRIVAAEHGCEIEYVFHELVHCIMGPAFTKLDEGYALMPFEWELARWLAPQLEDGSFFLDKIDRYQNVTEISKPAFQFDKLGPGRRKMRFWRQGIKRCIRLGLLDKDWDPTFKSPKWIGSGVATYLKHWSVSTDSKYA